MGPNRFEGVTPILNVASVPAAIAYYIEKLGFTLDWDWGSPPVLASVKRDEVCLFLCEGAQGGKGMWLSVFVQDVDALHAEYQARGAIIRQEPANFPWGMREMNVQDLDDHRLRMGCATTAPADGIALLEGP